MTPQALSSQVSSPYPPEIDVRERIARVGASLPAAARRLLQAFFTWVVGKPHYGQEPLVRLSPALHLAQTLLLLALGVTLSVIAYNGRPLALLLLPASFLFTISAQRKIYLTLIHAASHGTFAKTERGNRVAGEILSLLIFTQPHDQFKDLHVVRHHGKTFCTLEDPDMSVLFCFGIRPGISARRLWLRFFATLLSPRYHYQYTKARVEANLVKAPPIRRAIAWAAVVTTPVVVHLLGIWPQFIVAWLLPTFFGFHIASLTAFTGEHKWYRATNKEKPRQEDLMERTHARFFGSPPPEASAPWYQRYPMWITWWLELLFWHLPTRMLIVPSDMPAHDFHHVNPKGDWSNALYWRQRSVEAGEPYCETWGAFAAIGSLFAELSKLPEEAAVPAHIRLNPSDLLGM